jgi:hypothetical protein
MKKAEHKFSPPWEAYLVAEVIRPGAYRLQEINDATFPNVWNIEQLRMFYPLSFLFYFFSIFLSLSSGMRRMTARQ